MFMFTTPTVLADAKMLHAVARGAEGPPTNACHSVRPGLSGEDEPIEYLSVTGEVNCSLHVQDCRRHLYTTYLNRASRFVTDLILPVTCGVWD